MNEYRKLRLIAENAARDTLRKLNESRVNRIIESEVKRCFEDLDNAPNPSYLSDDDMRDAYKGIKNGIKKGIKKGGSYIKNGLKKAKKFMNDEFEKADSAENPTYFEESIRRSVKRVLREMEDTE